MKQKRRYYSLIDKVYEMENLYEAWLKVKKNKGSGGIDGITIEMIEKNLNLNLREIQRRLQENRYKSDPVRRYYIEKENGKLRPLGIPFDDQFHETEVGSPQGGVISPLLENIYFNHFDWKMKEQGFAVVRYADDAVILCKTKEKAEEAYVAAKTILDEELQLKMHPEKTKVVHFDEGFRFLGFDFWKGI
jgi:retron-type reverse transcriptase